MERSEQIFQRLRLFSGNKAEPKSPCVDRVLGFMHELGAREGNPSLSSAAQSTVTFVFFFLFARR